MELKRFNVRVYGILIENDRLLVSDELIKGNLITKLPGGGLEFGEGTLDCLKREFVEETGMQVEVIEHFYTTDFFVESAFNRQSQVISIYYLVKNQDQFKLKISERTFDFDVNSGQDQQSFRWVHLSDLNAHTFTFVIDKKVASMLQSRL